MYEMKKAGRYGIWFIDPNSTNEDTWKYEWYKADVEKNMLEFLKRLNTNEHILLPYNYTCVTLSCTTNYVFTYQLARC